MKNKCLLFKKLMNIFLLIACCFVFVGCEGENSVEEVSITISPSATTISTGESIKFEVKVSGSANQSFTWNISHPELLSIDINYNAVLKTEVVADTAITVTVTSDADKSKSDSTVILAKANNDKPTVPTPPVADLVVGIEGASEIKSGKSINLTAVVSGTDNQEVTWSIVDGSEYVSIDEKGVLTAINVDSDHNVKVKATSVANPDFSATKTITLVGKPELTQEMLDQISTDKLSFDGYIQINLYTTGIFEKLYQTYNTPIKTAMDGTNWYAEYLNGETGTAMQMYFKNHESVACQIGVSFMNDEEYFPMLDDLGNEVSWNEAGLYNSFPNLKVSDFKFNEEIWRYEYIGVDKTIINKIISSANPYDFDATNLSLIIDEGEILGIHSKAKADYTIVAGYKAMQELFVTMNYGDMVNVPIISKYSHDDIHDELALAIENMRNLESYKLDFKENTVTLGYSEIEVGFTETITPNDCHFQPYNVSYDLYGNIVKDYQKGSRYGYKKITDDLYNSYYEVGNGYTASRAYESDFSKAKPTFAFAAEIFREYYIDEAEGTTTYFVDPVMSTVSSTFYYGVGNDINLYGIFATSDVYVSINEQYKPYVVVKDGYIIEAGFYFFVGSIYGIVEIQYSDFNTAELPADSNVSFETRYVPTLWSQLTIEVSQDESSSTEDDITVNALEYLKSFYNDDNIGEKLPFFGNVVGDSYGFGLTTMYLPSGGNILLPAVMLYYDVPLDLDYTIDSSIKAVEEFLESNGFVRNFNGWYQKGEICIAPTDSSLDFVIYIWKA